MTRARQSDQPLRGRRILVCGKGGSGKSTLVALLATVLQRKRYEVIGTGWMKTLPGFHPTDRQQAAPI